jgi:hypothetical protein
MKNAVYDVTGKVLNPNGSPLAGVKVQIDGNATQLTGPDGSFTFKNEPAGNHTVRPVAPDYHYLPEVRSVKAEDELPQFFYAIPNQVTQVIEPNGDTVITFIDTQGLPTTIIFPHGVGPGQAIITPLMAGQPDGYLQTGHTMDIQVDSAQESAQALVKGQNDEPLSIEIKVKYNKADLQSFIVAD